MSVIIFSVKYKGESKLVAVSESFTYSDFVSEVAGKWVELRKIQFNYLCSVGSITSCCLGSKVDFKNLLLLCNHTSAKLVLVEVSPCVEQFQCSGTEPVNLSINSENRDVPLCGGSSSGRDSSVKCGGSKIRGSEQSDSVECSNSQGLGSSKKSRVHSNGESDSEYVIPSYEMCPALKKKPLLSDEWANIIDVGVGQQFAGGAVEFRKEIIKFAARNGFNFKYKKNTRRYIHAYCTEDAEDGCTWFIKAKLVTANDNFQIYSANINHSCEGKLVCEDGTRLGPNIMGDLLVQHVKDNHAMGGKQMSDIFLANYGIDAPYWKARRAVDSARKLLFGRYDDSYNQLRWYKKAIERTNPGSVVFLEINQETNRFERIFIAFKSSIDGFRCCRPMLFIDATFMRGQAKGCLLSATAKDGDNGLFPVAFAVVSAENTSNWEWFLTKLRDEIKHDRRIVFISDRNAGLLSAFPLVWDEPLHFYCLFHLITNLKGRFSRGCSRQHRADMERLFKECAYAPKRSIFHEKLELFKKEGGPAAVEWIEQLPFDKWAVAYSSHITRYGEMTSNAAESFNSWILKARYLPITNMIDSIRKMLSRWYVKRRKISSLWSEALCPTKEATWQRYTEYCRHWKIDECPNNQYEVHSTVSVTVNLPLRICTCYKWQIRGFPCPHAVAVIRKLRNSVYMHVDEGFLTKKYRETYMGDINPIPETERYENQCLEGEPKILPPELNNTPGRPRTKRKKSFGEGKTRKKKLCKTCGIMGYHNSVSCLIDRVDSSGTDSMESSEEDSETSGKED